MSQNLRYTGPADNHRPYGSTRYEVWSPKLRRGITLYGDVPLKAWIYLESIPAVEAFCERPLTFKRTKKAKRVVDFWVKWNDKEEIWLLKRRTEEEKHQQDKQLYSKFQQWAQANGMEARLIAPDLVALAEVEMQNWSVILHCLAANLHQVFNREDIHRKILSHFSTLTSLASFLHSNEEEDPVILQAAVFHLLHRGRLKSEEIAHNPLSLATRFQVA